MTDPLGGQMVVQREQLTPEQSAFVRAVDDFCARECPPHKLREITETIRTAVEQLSGQEYVDAYASSVKSATAAA